MTLGTRQRRYLPVAGVAALGLVTVLSPGAQAAPTTDRPVTAHRHTSGLLVVPGVKVPPVPEQLGDEYGRLELLSSAYPDSYGYVHLDQSGTKLVMETRSPQATSQVKALLQGKMTAGKVRATSADPYGKLPGVLAASGVSATETSTAAIHQTQTSRAELESVKDSAFDLAQDPRYADADIWQTEVDRSAGRVVLTAAHLTDVLAQTLVATYGTDLVAVTEQPNPHHVVNFGRQADNSLFYGGALIRTPLGNCSDAFSWRINSSVHGMLGVAHCAYNGERCGPRPRPWARSPAGAERTTPTRAQSCCRARVSTVATCPWCRSRKGRARRR